MLTFAKVTVLKPLNDRLHAACYTHELFLVLDLTPLVNFTFYAFKYIAFTPNYLNVLLLRALQLFQLALTAFTYLNGLDW